MPEPGLHAATVHFHPGDGAISPVALLVTALLAPTPKSKAGELSQLIPEL